MRTSGSVRLRIALSIALMAAAAPVAHAQAAPERVQVGIATSAETVMVGDPFRVAVRVRAPLGSTIEFPAGPDSSATVQLLDAMSPSAAQDPGAVDQTGTYRVAAWDVDSQRVELGEVVVRTPAGVQRFALSRAIFVRSVLPEDSTQRVPKPARPIFDEAAPPNWLWLLLAAAIALVGLLVWWWWRRRRRPRLAAPEDAYAHAREEFDRVERLGLLDAGERGRYVALMLDVMRAYLQARCPAAQMSHTSTELLVALRGTPTVPHERLGAVLAEGDLVKFARRAVSAERARHLGTDARFVVDATEEAVRRALAAEEAARQARAAGAEREAA